MNPIIHHANCVQWEPRITLLEIQNLVICVLPVNIKISSGRQLAKTVQLVHFRNLMGNLLVLFALSAPSILKQAVCAQVIVWNARLELSRMYRDSLIANLVQMEHIRISLAKAFVWTVLRALCAREPIQFAMWDSGLTLLGMNAKSARRLFTNPQSPMSFVQLVR